LSVSNHASAKVLRKRNRESMINLAMVEFLILFISIFRKRFINHPFLEGSFFQHDIGFNFRIEVSNYPLLFHFFDFPFTWRT